MYGQILVYNITMFLIRNWSHQTAWVYYWQHIYVWWTSML